MTGLADRTDKAAVGRTQAVLVGLVLAGLALAAHLGRLADSPVAATIPGLAAIGPGKAGVLRALPLDANGLPPAGSEALAAEALAGSPLAYEPFFVAATAGFRGQGKSGSAADAALLREALRRNPRARESHLLLLRHLVASGDLGGAIGELAVMNRLTTGITDKLMPAVGMAISTERQADDAVAGLAPHPELFEPFLRGFALAKKPPALAVRLITRLPQQGLQDPAVRDLAVSELVRAQAFAEARKLWGGAAQGLVHSPDFTDTALPPPFNWKLEENSTGVGERMKGGGISVTYYGRSPGPIAAQLLTLAPGNYRVRIDYRSDSGSPGALGLRMQCAGAEAPLFDMPMNAPTGALQALTVRFAVPQQGCAGQWLQIGGRVQESRDPQSAVVRAIAVERATQP